MVSQEPILMKCRVATQNFYYHAPHGGENIIKLVPEGWQSSLLDVLLPRDTTESRTTKKILMNNTIKERFEKGLAPIAGMSKSVWDGIGSEMQIKNLENTLSDIKSDAAQIQEVIAAIKAPDKVKKTK